MFLKNVTRFIYISNINPAMHYSDAKMFTVLFTICTDETSSYAGRVCT